MKRFSALTAVASFACLLTVSPLESQAAADADTLLALTHVTLIDGTGAPPVPNQMILIRGSRIVDIQDADRERLPDGVQVLNLKGRYVIPGLIDTHVHFGPNPFEEYTRPAAEARLRATLLRGITSVRDMASDARTLASLARDAKVGDILAPGIHYSALMAGPSFFAKDPRVSASARGEVAGEVPWHLAVTEATDLRQAVAEAKGAGASALKLYADLAPDLVRRLTKEAPRQGLQVWAHAALHPSGPGDLVDAGVDALSHVNLLTAEALEDIPVRFHGASAAYSALDPDTIDVERPLFSALFARMSEQGTVLDATVRLYMSGMENQHGPDDVDLACRLLRGAKEAGVPISTGTDGNRMPLRQEMGLLVSECGFTSVEAIRAATLHGAMAIGIQETHGSLEVGKQADLVVLGSDPADDLQGLSDVELVLKGGQLYEPDEAGGS